MPVSVADLDVARQPAADAEAGRAALLKLLIDAIVEMRREPIQDHDQLSRFRWEASCSSGSRPSLGALGIRWGVVPAQRGHRRWPSADTPGRGTSGNSPWEPTAPIRLFEGPQSE